MQLLSVWPSAPGSILYHSNNQSAEPAMWTLDHAQSMLSDVSVSVLWFRASDLQTRLTPASRNQALHCALWLVVALHCASLGAFQRICTHLKRMGDSASDWFRKQGYRCHRFCSLSLVKDSSAHTPDQRMLGSLNSSRERW